LIRRCSHDEMRRYIASRGIVVDAEIVADCYMVEQSPYSMAFTLLIDGDDAEVHIVCPKEFVIRSRLMAQEIMQHCKSLGVKTLTTCAGVEYKTAKNMALRLGFDFVGCYNEINVFKRVL
jgi:hypothetical protein